MILIMVNIGLDYEKSTIIFPFFWGNYSIELSCFKIVTALTQAGNYVLLY